jgi:hypothetical protein
MHAHHRGVDRLHELADVAPWLHTESREWTERDVELPWAAAILERAQGRILEVGNATQRVCPAPEREIVCRWDIIGGILPVYRSDILDWQNGPYDLILSVSTLEHVGHDDEEEQNPQKAQRAIEHCLGLLAPGGEMHFTVPCGYHEALQSYVLGREWSELHLLERFSRSGDWLERHPSKADHDFGWHWTPLSAKQVLFVSQRF